MQIEIRTLKVQPLRQTYGHVARRFGDKPASRYQEATYDIQPTANFHYRPTWAPEFQLYDTARTQIVMSDWYALKDPRQYYYGAYVTARARQQEAAETAFDLAERRGLLTGLALEWQERLITGLLPLRHVEWGANMNNMLCADYGYGTAITQACTYCAMDRLGIAQYISRIGLALDGNTGVALERARVAWLESEAWQPMRKLVEDIFVVADWFENFVAQNLVMDGLVYPLVYQHFDARAAREIGANLAMLTEFEQQWQNDHVKWIDSVIRTVTAESPANQQRIADWAAHYQARTIEALRPLAAMLLDDDAGRALEEVRTQFTTRLAKLGAAPVSA
ncbi:aromatic/alkene monooxygenase hydroxylase subunit beta [Paraburkholderia sp. BR13444]|uniref:aromatic/alkene monooxygenase hydroxylase subunit beta n=1 Tax=Paraburkholderia sp. BR13444 TaxID=3236997 RepID=UPI0034CE68A6